MLTTENAELKAATKPSPLTFCVTVKDGAAARSFYAAALGAKEITAVVEDDGSGRLAHAHLVADDTAAGVQLMLGSDYGGEGMNATAAKPGTRSPAHAFVLVPDVDVAFERFAKAGAVVTERPRDMFYGMRIGKLVDPFGVGWSFGTPFKRGPRVGDVAADPVVSAERASFDM